MESKRQQKFSRLLQRDLGQIFQQDSKHLFDKDFITVTTVRVSPDLGMARVYLSFLLSKNLQNSIEKVQEHTKTIRQMLALKIKNQVRVIPELQFFLDDTAEYAAKIDALIQNLDIPKEPAESPDNEQEED